MRFSTIIPLLAFAASTFAAPLSSRQEDDCGEESDDGSDAPVVAPEPTTFRFLGTVYCLVPTVNGTTSGPCDPSAQVPLSFDTNSNQTALVNVTGHSVNVTKVPANLYGDYQVTIDDILRNATGQEGPDDLFGPGITRSYDYPL